MRFVRHRRGLSNVVTTAIMLTSVAVLGTGLVAWSHGNLNAFQNQLATTTSTVTDKINENLVIENTFFCSNPICVAGDPYQGVSVTLTNTGTLAVNVTQIQVNNTVYTKTWSGAKLSTIIFPQQSAAIVASGNGFLWHSKSVSTIIVTTARGTILTTQAVALP